MSLTRQTVDYVAGLVKQRSAIQLPAGKEYLVESRLIPLAREAGFTGATAVDKWIQQVIATHRAGDLQDIAEALTTNETSFFRDVTPFKGLTESVVPSLAEAGHRNLSIWSAACSTGQEPYSIAMSLLEVAQAPNFSIVATDISRAVLAKARQGFYTQLEVNRGLPAPMLVRYFSREGANWVISPSLRSRINFLEHNLLSTPPKGGPFHIVFIRNVLIYFDISTKREVLRRVAKSMAPGGYLFLGAAETTMGMDPVWERVTLTNGAVYKLKGAGK